MYLCNQFDHEVIVFDEVNSTDGVPSFLAIFQPCIGFMRNGHVCTSV